MKFGLGFDADMLPHDTIKEIEKRARLARGDIITMTTLAESGHPGGSMSSLDIYMTLYACANVDPQNPYRPDRDRIVVSHGHTSPGVYSTLARNGFVDIEDVICGFRQVWSPFEGHIERDIPGVEWSTGNLGQGLSAGCGMALAARLTGQKFNVFVCMGDGEQQKGQISEARRFASKYKLRNLTAIVDYNRLQISGDIREVMPQEITADWEADGWEVLEIDGHDVAQIYNALHHAVQSNQQVCIMALTVMGRGVPSMQNKAKYHGSPLGADEYPAAIKALKVPHDLEHYRALRPTVQARVQHNKVPVKNPLVDPGTPRTYTLEKKTDNRSAFGNALEDLGTVNPNAPMAVFDCDLAVSVKTGGFAKARPTSFFQTGIEEHHAATAAGALSTQGVLTFWADFGVFGADETYNQQRLNDINGASLKTVCTHCGLDVGEDGKTHHAIDYVGVMRNLYGAKVILPADPNETDRVTRYVATQPGSFFVAVGRSKLDVITGEDGTPIFATGEPFQYGKAVRIREGKDLAILATGTMTHRAVKAWEKLKAEGISARVVHIATPLAIDRKELRGAAALGLIITYEDHHVATGLGSLTADALIEEGLCPRLIKMGVTAYMPSGTSEDLFAKAGLDTDSLVKKARESLAAFGEKH